MKQNKTKTVIPVGIFFTIFIFMLIISLAIAVSYFYVEAKNRIVEIEKYTRNYSISLAEAFANVAELSYKDKDFDKIKRLFRDKIQANIIDEAFFVLSDGKIVVHSDKEIEEELKGNIATDEFAYNIDLIMLPIWTRTDHVQFMDYNIFSENNKFPFNKDIKKLLKKYIYSKIDVLGWLVTKAVYVNGKGIGCVTFIISKDRIYKFLLEHFNKTVMLSYILAVISFILSFLISIIIFIRYRNISRIKYQKRTEEEIANVKIFNESDLNSRKIKEAIKIRHGSIKIKELFFPGDKKIKDAIIVKDKEYIP